MADIVTSGKAELTVDGLIYGGWRRVAVTRSIEQIANTYELGVTERWPGQSSSRPIRPGSPCRVALDGETVITGFTDDSDPAYDKQSHELEIKGRDATGDLVDCSAIYKTGQWFNATLDRIARDLCAPFGIKVINEAGAFTPFSDFKIEEGETVFECIERGARLKAVLLIADSKGGLVITRAGKRKAQTALVEGENILAARGHFSWKDRHSTYTIKGQERGTDDFSGENAAGPSATVRDEVINRYRPLVVLAEAHGAHATFRDRAEWERNVRMGRGNRASITVQGWRDGSGALWQPNTLVQVHSPELWLDDAEMLIVGCAHTLDDNGTRTTLSIARREAFDLVAGIGSSKLGRKLNDKEQREKRKKGDDWSAL